ncbi:MAG: DUF2442 domain-containing protein [Anaerovibrio sp.]|uniref:DUF2442 domain-containing protein n=1 Tax=Anaerovibrio sp. TaxID=1872532 RepID=UPI0025E54535|nr:DUF2442 domain-containing protein [Anaerovibrio sp.]MCR5176831.1 DUF2442 domain-containing protein [Anaerovibrio sp.]
MKELMLEVIQAVAAPDFKVYAYFNDGTIHLYDAKPLIMKSSNTVFAPLQDESVFNKTLTVLNNTVAWDIVGNRNERKCIDIDPYTIYESEEISDPLAE